MFLSNQHNIDRFAANFCETESGDLLFAPDGPETGVPVTWEEYEAAVAAYERAQTRSMAMMWVLLLSTGGYGLHQLIMRDTYQPFLIGVGLASVLSLALMVRAGLGTLAPFIKRRAAMLAERRKIGATFE